MSFFEIQYAVRRIHFVHSKVSRHLSFGNCLNSKYELFLHKRCHTSYMATIKGPERNSNIVECTIFSMVWESMAP